MDRGNVDDAAPTTFLQVGHGTHTQAQKAHQVDIHHLFVKLGGIFHNVPVGLVGGIVHQNIQPSEFFQGEVHHLLGRLGFCQVAPQRDRLAPPGADEETGLLRHGHVGVTNNDHLGSGFRQADADSLANPLAAAGDDGHQALQQAGMLSGFQVGSQHQSRAFQIIDTHGRSTSFVRG